MQAQFLTWYLWKRLFRSLPRHPLFISQYAPSKPSRRKKEPTQRSFRQRLLRAFLVVVSLAILIPIMVILAIPGVSLVFVFILFGGTIIGMSSAFSVASQITRYYEKNQVSILGVTVPGIAGMSWALAIRYLRINKQARQLRRLIVVFYAMIAVGILSFLSVFPFLAILDTSAITTTDLLELAIYPAIDFILIILMIMLDMMQSIMIGVLIGVIVANVRQGNRDANIASMSLFLLLQSVFYIVFISFASLIGSVVDSTILNGILRLWLLFVLREITLRLLWRQFTVVLNTSTHEINELVAFSPSQQA